MTLKNTSGYYHKPGNHFFLKLRSHGDVPRVVSVLIAEGVDKDGVMDSDLKGLVLLDRGSKANPDGGVVIEFAYADDPDLAREAFDRLEKADWPYLINFLLGQNDDLPKISPSAFYKNMPEIEKIVAHDMAMGAALRAGKTAEPSAEYLRLIKAPESGDFETLLRISTKGNYEPDLRTEDMKAENDDPRSPYKFPRITRKGIIAEMKDRGLRAAERGDQFLSWSLDISCSEDDLADVDSHYRYRDEAYWELYLDIHRDKASTMLEDACREVSEEWEETHARYHWTSYEKDEGRLYLKGIYQTGLEMSEDNTMDDILSRMSDEDIVEFWANCRKLDVDTHEDAVRKSILDKITPLREKKELEWDDNPSLRYALGTPMRRAGVSY